MIFKLQVVLIDDKGQQETCEITSVERKDLKPATLGLTLAEGKAILKDIQEIVIQRQAALCLATYRQCPDCGALRTGNGYHDLSVRTVFGHLKVKSACLHHCDCRPHESKTFSPLADLLPAAYYARATVSGNQMGFADELWDDDAIDGRRAAYG